MMIRKFLIPLFLTLSINAAAFIYPQTTAIVRIAEKPLRKMARKTVMPDYPKEARKRGGKGVAVAQLEIDENGDVVKVEVLEAPDPLIYSAVESAVKAWKFNAATVKDRGRVRVQGKLTFYFIIDKLGARVENPQDISK